MVGYVHLEIRWFNTFLLVPLFRVYAGFFFLPLLTTFVSREKSPRNRETGHVLLFIAAHISTAMRSMFWSAQKSLVMGMQLKYLQISQSWIGVT